mmetsp:Transcript_47858/g.138401  ORF Transcript_47858/g.138401 Transcript_47858/m.138401 type:complete len:101 (+) Transcript_47858:74-376(+)
MSPSCAMAPVLATRQMAHAICLSCLVLGLLRWISALSVADRCDANGDYFHCGLGKDLCCLLSFAYGALLYRAFARRGEAPASHDGATDGNGSFPLPLLVS